jgi:hypothetical protein
MKKPPYRSSIFDRWLTRGETTGRQSCEALAEPMWFALALDITGTWATTLSWVDPGLARLAPASAESQTVRGLPRWTFQAFLLACGAVLFRATRLQKATAMLLDDVPRGPLGREFPDGLYLALAERRPRMLHRLLMD